MAVDFSILQRTPMIGSRIMAGQQMAREQALQNRLLARQDLQFQQQQEDRARALEAERAGTARRQQLAQLLQQSNMDPTDLKSAQQFYSVALQANEPNAIKAAQDWVDMAFKAQQKRQQTEATRAEMASVFGPQAGAAPAAAAPSAGMPPVTSTLIDEGAARPEARVPMSIEGGAQAMPVQPQGAVTTRDISTSNALAPAAPAAAPQNRLGISPAQIAMGMQSTNPAVQRAAIEMAKLLPPQEKPVDTRPKPEKVQLGGEVVFLDMNPSSPTFRQEIVSRRVSAAPESPGAAEARRINQFRADLEAKRLEFQQQQAAAQAARDAARDKRDAAAAARAQTQLDQADRRLAMAEDAAARAADPEFQARMERARTMAAAVAKDDAALLSQGPSALEAGQRTLALLNRMVGDPKGQGAAAQPHPGFTGTIGMTFTPGMRFVPGTPEADFSAMLEQVQGGAFLEAYERLKGTGQITEIEGKKATQAITRMNTAISEREFMQAAKEFREAIDTAMNRTQTRIAKAQRGAPGRGAVGGEALSGAGNTVTPEARQQALDWLRQNPNDPRAAQIKQRLGM